MQIEQHTNGMHKHHAQQAIAQVPQITSPDALRPTAVRQLSEDGIDAIAHPSQHRTPAVSGLRAGFAKRSQQHHPNLAQGRLQRGQPVVAISQEQPARACRQIPDDFTLMHVGRGQVHLGNDSRPTQPQMQPKAVEGLPTGMIFAKAGTVVKPMAAIGARKLADRDRHTIHDRHRRIIEQEAVTDKAPQPLFHGPQVGRLAHKGRTIDLRHRWEKVCVVAAEVVKHFLILAQTQVGSGHSRFMASLLRNLQYF